MELNQHPEQRLYRKAMMIGIGGCLLIAGIFMLNEIKDAKTATDLSPIMVFEAGISLDIGNGEIVQVYGDDLCPAGSLNKDQRGCVVLLPPSVPVHLIRPNRPTETELWTVRSEAGRTYVTRPNGAIVSQPHANPAR